MPPRTARSTRVARGPRVMPVPRRAAPKPAPPPAPPPRRRRLSMVLLRWGVILAVWLVLAAGGVLLWFARDLPRPEAALDTVRRPSLVLTDASGRSFASFGDLVGEPLRLRDMPSFLPQAAIAIEDRRFRYHPGLDPVGILRAVWVNLTAGQLRQGGSTITQQVAKTLFLTNERTFRRKVQELMLTVWLERHFSKDEILEIWLNRVYLGAGTWGVDAAARAYFGVSARRVNLWQAAVLAGLPKAPSRLNPRADPEAAASRAREVLGAMVETGAISAAQAREAGAAIAFPPPPPRESGWFADWAAEQAATLVPPNADAVLTTTLDLRLQRVVEAKLAGVLAGPGAQDGVGEGAVVVLDAASGAVRAMAGGRDWRAGAFNRAVTARRQPGSAFKPFVWLAALEAGRTPDDTVLDAPVNVGGWRPANFDGRYRGTVTLETALAQSLNTAAVRLEMESGGPRYVTAIARRLGLTGRLPDDATLALGTGEASLLELASAYSAFFNGGRRAAPVAVTGGRAGGAALPIPDNPPEQAMEPGHAEMMARMLAAAVRGGTGRAAAIRGRAVAGKTGTTQDNRDAWFVGWVGAGSRGGLVIAVWLGNDDNAPMKGVTGGGLPARLFREIAAEVR